MFRTASSFGRHDNTTWQLVDSPATFSTIVLPKSNELPRHAAAPVISGQLEAGFQIWAKCAGVLAAMSEW